MDKEEVRELLFIGIIVGILMPTMYWENYSPTIFTLTLLIGIFLQLIWKRHLRK